MNIKTNSIITYLFGTLLGTGFLLLTFGSPVEPVSAAGAHENQLIFRSPSLNNTGNSSVIAAGLNNPRGLNFGPNGALYVAEAGSGGAGPCAPGPEGVRCYGTTGSITRINLRQGTVTRIASGLPSLASEDGSFATGFHDISFQGLGSGFMTTGFGGNPADRSAQFGAAGANFARLARINPSGGWKFEE